MDIPFNKAKLKDYETKPFKISYEKLTLIYFGTDEKLRTIFEITIQNKNAKLILENKKYLSNYFGKNWYEYLELEVLFNKSLDKLRSADGVISNIFSNSTSSSQESEFGVKKERYMFPVKFIPEFINYDDSIENLKNNIYIHTGVVPDFQHLTYEYKSKLIPIGYKYYDNNRELSVDISSIFNIQKVFNLIDEKMYFRHKNDRLYYENLNKYLLKDYKTLGNEIGLVNIKTFLENYNINSIQELFQDIENKKKFFVTFVSKYWPNMNEIKFNNILNNEKIQYLSKDIMNQSRVIEQKIINYLHSIDSKDIKLDLDNSSITLIMFHINYPQNSLKKKDKFLNLRGIFDFFETTEDVPFVKFNDSITGKTIKKLYKPALKYIPKQDIKKMFTGEHPKGIHFRTRIVKNPRHQDYFNFMPIINIHDDGKVEFRPSWKQMKNTDFGMITDCVETITNFIKRINEIHHEINQQSKDIRIPNKKSGNMDITFLNINIKFKLPSKEEIDFNKLNEIIKVLNPFVSLNKKELLKDEIENIDEGTGAYLRYKRVQNFELYLDNAIKVLKEVYVFSDKRIIIELINFFNMNREDATRKLDIWNKINLATVTEERQNIFKEYGKDVEKAINRFTKKIGIDIKIQGPKEDGYNIIIEGVNSISQYEDIFNFLGRLLHIYDNLDNILKKKSIFTEIFKKNTRGKIFTKKQLKLSVKDTKKVKNLKIADPKLFDINPNVNLSKYKLYSKLCQGDRRQPNVFNEEEFKKLNIKTDEELKKNKDYQSTYALKVKNKTYPDKVNYYVCEDDKYKYPGFLQSNKHPDNLCLICCHTSSSLNPNKPTKHSTYNSCKGQEDVDTESSINIKYVKQAGKAIKPDGLGKLPKNLDNYLNENMKYVESKNNILENGSDYYLKYGIKQDNTTFLNIIEQVLGFSSRKQLINNIENIVSNTKIFNSLGNGNLKYKFKTSKNYIKYLENKENQIIDEEYTWDLLTQPNLGKNNKAGINILILNELEDGNINIICPYHDEIKHFISPEKKTLVIYKSAFSINPVFRVKVLKNKLEINPFMNSDEDIFKKIINIYNDKCFQEKRRFENRFENLTGFKIPHNLIDLQDELLKTNKFKLKYQHVDNLNHTVGLIFTLKNKKDLMYIPCKPSEPIKNLNSIDTNFDYDYNVIMKIVDNLFQTTNIKIEIIKYIVDANDKIIKLLTNYGTSIPIKPITKSKIIKKLPYEKSIFKESEIDKFINNKETLEDGRIKAVKIINYNDELYQLLRMEFSKLIENEKDLIIRKKIFRLIDKKSSTLKEDLKNIGVAADDRRKIIEINLNEKDIEFKKKSIMNLKIMQDQKIKQSINNIINDQNLKYEDKDEKLLKLIKNELKKIIISGKKIPDLTNYSISNIRKTCNVFTSKGKCNENIHCVFDKDGTCKLYIPEQSDFLIKMVINLSQELLKNILKRNEILNNNIDLFIDKNKYIKRGQEVLVEQEEFNINELY
jgi:hypothetical protein